MSVGYLPVCRASAALPAAPGAARTSTTVPRPALAELWQAACFGPAGHCALMKALVVITAPFPSPPVPAFRDARPITRKLAACGVPSGSATVTRTVPPTRAPVARIVATPSMMSRSPRGRRPSRADSRAAPRTGVIATVRTCLPLTLTSTKAPRVICSMASSSFRLFSTGPLTFACDPGVPSEEK